MFKKAVWVRILIVVPSRLAKKDEAIKAETYPHLINNGANENITFEEACEWYWKQITPHKRDHNDDKLMLTGIMNYYGKGKMIRDITPDDIRNLRVHLSNLVSKRTKKNYSAQKINHYHSILKAMINALIKHDKYNGRNPAAKVSMPRLPRNKPRYIAPNEEQIIRAEVIKHDKLWPFYYVALHTGMRLGEVAHIKARDVSLHSNTIFLPETKNGRSRHVPMSPNLKSFIREQMEGKKADDYVLGDTTHWTVSDWFSEITRNLGYPNVTFHSLRHTFIQRLLAAGEPIYKVSKLVGHSSVEVTEGTYGHLSQQDLQGTLNRIDTLI